MSLESDGGMIYLQGKTEELGEKPVPVPLCPPQIPHGFTLARARASTAELDIKTRGKILFPFPGMDPRSPGRPIRS
jgi:hypothetical protein